MADIGAGLSAKLLADNTVAGLVSARIYPDRRRQKSAVPAAVYYVIGGVDEHDLQAVIGLAHSRIQIDAYANTRLVANSLATAIRNAICSAAGSKGIWGSVGVNACTPASAERYDTQDKGDGSDEPWYITSRDYLVSHQA